MVYYLDMQVTKEHSSLERKGVLALSIVGVLFLGVGQIYLGNSGIMQVFFAGALGFTMAHVIHVEYRKKIQDTVTWLSFNDSSLTKSQKR